MMTAEAKWMSESPSASGNHTNKATIASLASHPPHCTSGSEASLRGILFGDAASTHDPSVWVSARPRARRWNKSTTTTITNSAGSISAAVSSFQMTAVSSTPRKVAPTNITE